MIDSILAMQSSSDFVAVSKSLLDSSKRARMYQDLNTMDIQLSADDLWTTGKLSLMSMHNGFVDIALAETALEEASAKLVHRLQLIAHVNPGIRDFVDQFLERACV